MSKLPLAVENVIEALSNLPGIGSRSAERLTFTLLRNHAGLDQKIAQSLAVLRSSVAECAKCCHLCDAGEAPDEEIVCGVCADPKRTETQICVVENPSDILAIERTGQFRGVYHVLHGLISPMDRVRVTDIRLEQLLNRFTDNKEIVELIFALPASTEGESTAFYITDQVQTKFSGKITRLARGIPSGGVLDYLDAGTLGRAMMERRNF